MQTIFLVKKDPAKAGSEENWIIMELEEYKQFLETEEGKLRKDCFEKLEAVDEDDTIIYMECGREKAAEKKSERNHYEYLHRQEAKSGFVTVSLDMPADMGEEGDETTLLDLIVDEEADTENTAIEKMVREALPAALSELNELELELILAIYTREERMTINRYASKTGTSRRQIRKHHDSAIRKLRLYYRRKKLL